MLQELNPELASIQKQIDQFRRNPGGRKPDDGGGGLELDESDLENRVSKCERLLYLLVGLQAPQLLDSLASTGVI